MGVLRGYEQLIQKFCGLPFPLFHNMCILPQNKSGTCVTDKLLYGLWRLPCFEQVGDYGMPQVMVGNFQSRNAHRCIDGRYCLGQTYRKETSGTHGKGKKAVLKICSLRLYKASTYKLDYENDIFFCRMMQQSLHKNDQEYHYGKYWAQQGWLGSSRPWK